MHKFIRSLIVLSICLGPWAMALGDDLDSDLRDLDSLRNLFDTDFEEVNRRGEALLAEYDEPEAQARIHYQLALIDSNSGMQQPDVTIEHIKAAFALPLDSEMRPLLYSYWGSAIWLKHRDARRIDLHGPRKQAATQLLIGLRFTLDLHDQVRDEPIIIPDRAGEEEPVTGPSLRQQAERAQKNAESRKEKRLDDLDYHVAAFEQQLAYFYTRRPHNTDELEALVGEMLQGRPEVAKRIIDKTISSIEEQNAWEAAKEAGRLN
jgi:hypothetical protein